MTLHMSFGLVFVIAGIAILLIPSTWRHSQVRKKKWRLKKHIPCWWHCCSMFYFKASEFKNIPYACILFINKLQFLGLLLINLLDILRNLPSIDSWYFHMESMWKYGIHLDSRWNFFAESPAKLLSIFT